MNERIFIKSEASWLVTQRCFWFNNWLWWVYSILLFPWKFIFTEEQFANVCTYERSTLKQKASISIQIYLLLFPFLSFTLGSRASMILPSLHNIRKSKIMTLWPYIHKLLFSPTSQDVIWLLPLSLIEKSYFFLWKWFKALTKRQFVAFLSLLLRPMFYLYKYSIFLSLLITLL